MNNLFLGCLLLIAIACDADTKVPKKVSKAFNLKYRGVQEMNWVKQHEGFVVTFEHDSYTKLASFDKDGNWINTTTNLMAFELPDCIKNTIKKEYGGSKFMEAVHIERPDMDVYRVIIRKADYSSEGLKSDEPKEDDSNKGITRLVFQSNCQFTEED